MSDLQRAGERVGVEIWRIEHGKPKPWPKEVCVNVMVVDGVINSGLFFQRFGEFYSGDAYIVMSTSKDKGRMSWDVHAWIGASCDSEESSSAAYHVDKLMEAKKDKPIQHREVRRAAVPHCTM